MKAVSIFVVLTAALANSLAQTPTAVRSFWDGHRLKDLCGKADYAEKHSEERIDVEVLREATLCRGYVTGVADQLEADDLIRTPLQVTDIDVVDIVNLYIQQHPEKLYFSAPSVIGLALSEQFPSNHGSAGRKP
jgi:Ssp1 endopeptidase immunity protein Rap1a